MMDSPRVGIALGSGGARGWAHIGVMQALEELGVKPAVISGCSAGAIVAGAYAGNNLQTLADWLVTLTRRDILGFFDFGLLSGGAITGERLFDFFRNHIGDSRIEDLPIPFTAIATDLVTGREAWLDSGSLLNAVRASISLPGIFTPIKINEEWMIDGGLVNPIPVSACWAMKADMVIAVNVNAGILRAHYHNEKREEAKASAETGEEGKGSLKRKWFKRKGDNEDTPGLLDVVHGSILVMQEKITRSRLAGDPPDLLLLPRVSDIGLMEFHQAQKAIDEGRRCVERASQAILDLVEVNR